MAVAALGQERVAVSVASRVTGRDPGAHRHRSLGSVGQAAWNCSASVEPDRATVSALGEIAEVTRSK